MAEAVDDLLREDARDLELMAQFLHGRRVGLPEGNYVQHVCACQLVPLPQSGLVLLALGLEAWQVLNPARLSTYSCVPSLCLRQPLQFHQSFCIILVVGKLLQRSAVDLEVLSDSCGQLAKTLELFPRDLVLVQRVVHALVRELIWVEEALAVVILQMLTRPGSAQVLLNIFVKVINLYSIRPPTVYCLHSRPHAANLGLSCFLVWVVFVAAAVVCLLLFLPEEGQPQLFEHNGAVQDVYLFLIYLFDSQRYTCRSREDPLENLTRGHRDLTPAHRDLTGLLAFSSKDTGKPLI